MNRCEACGRQLVSAESRGTRLCFCQTIPTCDRKRRRSRGPSVVTLRPSRTTRPAEGSTSRNRHFIAVDLPDPFAPISAVATPEWTAKSRPCRTGLPPKSLASP